MTYCYECDACQHAFEAIQSIHDKALVRCPQCHKHKLFRVVTGGLGFMMDEPKTVGVWAERNAKKLGREKCKELAKQHRAARDKIKRKGVVSKLNHDEKPKGLPWYRSGEVEGVPRMEKQLDLTQIKDVNRYVETGEK